MGYMSPDRSAEVVKVLNSDDLVTTADGRKIKALSFARSNDTVSLGSILGRALGYPDGYNFHYSSSGTLLLEKISHIVGWYNRSHQEQDQITPIVVSDIRQRNKLILPREQKDRMVELLRQNQTRLEPFLPFGVGEKEMEQLRQGDPEVRGRVRIRMVRLGLTFARDLPQKEALINIIKVMNHPNTLEVLLKSDPPVGGKSNFQKLFKTSIYRKGLNYHRAQESLKERQRLEALPFRFLEGSPLEQFFTDQPLESPKVQRLLATLTYRQREVFIDRYLKGKSLRGKERVYLLAKSRLEKVIRLPEENWPKPDITKTAHQLIKLEPRFFINFFETLDERRQEYARLRFEEGLTNQEIAARLNTTEGAIKILGFRFCTELVSRAIDKGLVKESEVEWGKFRYR